MSAGDPVEFSAHPRVLERASQLLSQGRILAIKGLGGFHLACDASNDHAVTLLRERKRRSGKAFAILTGDLSAAKRLCLLTPADRALLTGPRRPIVLLPRRDGATVSKNVAPGNPHPGVMLPYRPCHTHRSIICYSSGAPSKPS